MLRKAMSWGRGATPIVALCLVWEVAVRLFGIPTYILPPPSLIILKIDDAAGLLADHAAVSFIEILAGFFGAAIVGFILAVCIAYSRWIERTMEPIVIVSQVVPKVALAPLFIIWFGYGMLPKIIIAATIAFFPVLVNTVLGLKSVDREIVELMDSIAATKRQVFWRVRLPHSLPYIFPSLRVAVLLAVVGAMVGEFVGANEGLGYLMILGDVNLDTELLFAALAIVTVFGFILYSLIGLAHRLVLQRFGDGESQQLLTL